MLGCRHRTPNQVQSNAAVIPEYLYHGIMSWDISHTWSSATTVAIHLTQKSSGLLIMPTLYNIL